MAESENGTGNSCSTALVPHSALGELIHTSLVTLTGMFKAWKIQNQTKPNQNLLINRISFLNRIGTIILT
jgi:hypothetical protein